MTRVQIWFLAVAIATVGLACGSDSGSSPTGTGGSGDSGGASGHAGSGGTSVGGSNGAAGVSGAAGTAGGAAAGGGAGGGAGSGGQTGAGGGAGVGGGAGAGGGAGGGGATGGQAGSAGTGVCGGIAGLTCDLGQFCEFGNGQCGAGDQQGQCELSGGAVCIQQVVCGCDGNSYASACQAHANGVDIMGTTACIPGNGGAGAPCGGDSDCMSGYKCCVTGGRVGSPIACRQITGACPALP